MGTPAGADLSVGGEDALWLSPAATIPARSRSASWRRRTPRFPPSYFVLPTPPCFGASRKINGLTQAILLLGVDRVKTMAAVVVMNRMVRPSVSIPALRKVWIHSLATALIAEEAAARMGVGRDAGYTAGLLHNLGSLGLMSAYPQEYSRMLEVSRDFGFDLLNTERDLFEIDHCAAGAWLAKEWNFPDELVEAIAAHHEEPTAGSTGLQSLVQISWRLADALGFAAVPGSRIQLPGADELPAPCVGPHPGSGETPMKPARNSPRGWRKRPRRPK
jgi:putative nucleotidyltransferase with HDIG domain